MNIVLIVLIVLVLTACGGGGDSEATDLPASPQIKAQRI